MILKQQINVLLIEIPTDKTNVLSIISGITKEIALQTKRKHMLHINNERN